jgi:ring-1,2-phenylacetyl-CoA epoxidase subunit PaaE
LFIFAKTIAMSQFQTLPITSVERITDNSVALSFTIPKEIKDKFRFKAGQYITLKTTINGEEMRRDYSICASTSSGDLTVAVKSVDGGIVFGICQ